ncbi:DUF397 domain-containing protein [Saccharopolyspora soli]|uniref:DUF397 domain-containing protein n=1 Tax=Saccharopolyspora soli TaxID=2926618 RepID=UPI0024138DEE|nr:DUF397 domain-containing protein [Saccharopolyspora soli]
MHHRDPSSRELLAPQGWRTAASCGPNGGNCVEVNLSTPGRVGVRDSKGLTGDVVLDFNTAAWTGFLAATRSGRFDRG